MVAAAIVRLPTKQGSSSPTFTTSSRGLPNIRIGKYNFSELKKNKTGLKKSWWCNEMARGCRARIVTLEDQILKYRKEHNH
ncbi:FLYWCH zinc finger domain-containing protein [Phthorimaea operculella]|nr:FLYWCH zinc finger domain-containing protein [Phthorimaea operculella]